MIKLSNGGAYLLNGVDIIEDDTQAGAKLSQKLGAEVPSKEEAKKNTIHRAIWTSSRLSLTK